MNRKGDLQSKRKLANLIENCMAGGQRSDGIHRTAPKRWTNSELGSFLGQGESTVRAWKNYDNPVTPDDIEGILNQFYGDLPKFAVKRTEMFDVWLAAKGMTPINIDDLEDRYREEPIARWKVSPLEQTEGLAELRLHQPRVSNDGTSFYLDATLRLDRAEYDYQSRTVFIALRSATLVIDSSSHQAAKGSLIGERSRLDDVNVKPHGVEFAAKEGEYLSGDVLQGEYVASMESTGIEGSERVVVSLHAGRQAFFVEATSVDSEDRTTVATSAEKGAILDALIHSTRKKDRLGRTILARSRLRK
ncbi:hypothetical protein ACQZ40_22895 [Agrobacterium sp. 16-172Ci]